MMRFKSNKMITCACFLIFLVSKMFDACSVCVCDHIQVLWIFRFDISCFHSAKLHVEKRLQGNHGTC